MDFEGFRKKLSLLKESSSAQGKLYTKIQVAGQYLQFVREGKTVAEQIKISELFEVYKRLSHINTTILRDHITGRKFSPALAVLKAAGFYDIDGTRMADDTSHFESPSKNIPNTYREPVSSYYSANQVISQKDEERVFRALKEIIGSQYLYAKSLGRPFNTSLVYFNSDYRQMGLPNADELAIESALQSLGSDFQLPQKSLTHYIDGLIKDHPKLGTRVVEFDEEQHFTPARKITLKTLPVETFSELIKAYKSICNDAAYFQTEVLPKHRLKLPKMDRVLEYSDFLKMLSEGSFQNNGYIAPKKGFPFNGGRMAQRAYYDLLRDFLHRSAFNKDLNLLPIIRIPKPVIEQYHNKPISLQSTKELKESILAYFGKIGLSV